MSDGEKVSVSINEQKKTCLFVMGFNSPFPGAGWNRLSYIANYFQAHGMDCSLLATFELNKIGKRGIKDSKGIRIYNILPTLPVDNAFSIIFDNVTGFVYSFPILLGKKPNVIILSIAPAHQLISFYWISWLLRKKLIIDIRDEVDEGWLILKKKPLFFYRAMNKIFSKIYRNCYLVCPTTVGVANNIKQRGVSPSKVHVVADGVDTEIFKKLDKVQMKKRLDIPENKFVVLFLGQVYSAYRVDVIIDALSVLKKEGKGENYLFLLVGGGSTQKVFDYAQKLGVMDMVKYAGIITDQKELVKVINTADIGIIPYNTLQGLKRMYPTKLFEYAACGLPVIATYWEDSLLIEYLKKYGLGVSVLPGDGKALAIAIEKMREEITSGRSLYSDNGLRFASQNTKAKIAEGLMASI